MFGWLGISKSVYIYDYGVDFDNEFCPHPNVLAMCANMKFYAENGIKGILIEAGANPSERTTGYDMEFLRSWVLTKLMWNPYLNPQDLIKEFTDGYYGKAGKDIRAYIDIMHNASEAMGSYIKATGSPINDKFLSIETLDEAWSSLKAAESNVKDDNVLLSRVQSQQLPVLYIFIARWQELQYAAKCRGIKWPIDESMQNVYDYFIKVASENKIGISSKTKEQLSKALNPAS
jgi:hypothetical protein